MSELSVDRGGAGVGSPATMKEFHAERRPRNKGSAAPPARASTQRSGVALHGYEQSAPRFCLHEPSSVAHPRAESRIHLEAWLCVARSETSFSPEAGHWSDRHRRGPARSRQSAPVLAFRSDASARVLVRAAPAADDWEASGLPVGARSPTSADAGARACPSGALVDRPFRSSALPRFELWQERHECLR